MVYGPEVGPFQNRENDCDNVVISRVSLNDVLK